MYSPYAMDMIYDEECDSRDHEILSLQARLSSMSEMIKNMSMGINQPSWSDAYPNSCNLSWTQPPNVSWSHEQANFGASSMDINYSTEFSQQPHQEVQSSPLENMLKEYIEKNEASRIQMESLLQSRSTLLSNLEIIIGQLAEEVRNQSHGIQPIDTEIFEDVRKDHCEPVLVGSEEVLEVSQTNSILEGFVDESSEVSTADALVSDKSEHNFYEDSLREHVIKNPELENIEDEHQDLLEMNLLDTRMLNYFDSSGLQSTEINSSKTPEAPIDLELNSMSSQIPDVYSSSSPTLTIIISADLPPDKEDNFFEILQKHLVSFGRPMSIFCDLIRSV